MKLKILGLDKDSILSKGKTNSLICISLGLLLMILTILSLMQALNFSSVLSDRVTQNIESLSSVSSLPENSSNIESVKNFLGGQVLPTYKLMPLYSTALVIFSLVVTFLGFVLLRFSHVIKEISNHRVDPTVKTPVESGEAQGTAGHP